MNVLIITQDVHSIRLIQTIVDRVLGEAEDKQIFLEWSIKEIDRYASMQNIDLLICDMENVKSIEECIGALKVFRKKTGKSEILLIADNLENGIWEEVVNLSCLAVIKRPFEETKLQQIIMKGIEKVNDLKRYQAALRQSQNWKKHERMIEQQFWMRFLNGRISLNTIDVIQEAESCGISIRLNDTFHIAVLSRKLIKHRNEQIEIETRRILIQAAYDWFKQSKADYTIVEQKRPILIIKNISTDDFTGLCESFIAKIREMHQIPLCCYYDSDIYCENIFLKAFNILSSEREDMPETPGMYRVSEIAGSKGPEREVVIPQHAEELFLNGHYPQFIQLMKSYLIQQSGKDKIGGSDLRALQIDVLQLLYCKLKEQSIPAHKVLMPESLRDLENNAHISVDSFIYWLEAVLQLMPEKQIVISIADAIKKYVVCHLGDKITRKQLAQMVYMNEDYLCKIFRKETGESLGYYITMEKMKEAEKMLVNTDKSVGEIGIELGYENFSYFSKLFNKCTGMSPREYRKQYVKELNIGDMAKKEQ